MLPKIENDKIELDGITCTFVQFFNKRGVALKKDNKGKGVYYDLSETFSLNELMGRLIQAAKELQEEE